MKVLQIINSLDAGGAEKLLLETIPLYNQKGIKMDILVLNGNDYPFMKELKLTNSCQIFSLGSGSVYNPLHIFKIISYLKKYQIAHVHLFPAQYWAVLAKWISFSKVKLVFTEHNTHNRRMSSPVFKICDKIIYSGYKKVVCITSEVKRILEQHLGKSGDKFPVIENGVNLKNIKEAIPYTKTDILPEIAEEDKLLIQVSAFREQKDQVTLIKSLTALPENVKLILVGDGALRKDCENLVKELKLEKRIFFLGLRMDVLNLLKTADIVVLSSKYEGLSLSSMEGMASGKPFVASDVPGLHDVVKNAGILFPQGDEKALSTAILKLLDDKQYYEMTVQKCLQRAEEYDIIKMVNKHIQLYYSIIN